MLETAQGIVLYNSIPMGRRKLWYENIWAASDHHATDRVVS